MPITGVARPFAAEVGRRMTGTPPRFDAASAFGEHADALLGFAVNALRDRGLAEDCVQETFLRAWRARDSFDASRGGERGWLFAIARRVIIDAGRARAKLPRITGDDELAQQAAPHADPLQRLGLIEAMALLSDDQRHVVVAVHILGRSYQEVSDETGTPVATLRTRTFYALRALRETLASLEEQS